jgi:hypothetical protein
VKTRAIFKRGGLLLTGRDVFLRRTIRRKDGKEHHYWSLVDIPSVLR